MCVAFIPLHLLGCCYIEVYGIRYTVYGIWYTRIPVIEPRVYRGSVYINILIRSVGYAILIYIETCMFVFGSTPRPFSGITLREKWPEMSFWSFRLVCSVC